MTYGSATWSKDEVYLLEHLRKSDITAICYAVGKSPKQVTDKAHELGIVLKDPAIWDYPQGCGREDIEDVVHLRLSENAMFCPRCGGGVILPWTTAGRHGFCEACYKKALADAADDVLENIRAEKQYAAKRSLIKDSRTDDVAEGNRIRSHIGYDRMVTGG